MEVRPKSPWNYGLLEKDLEDAVANFEIIKQENEIAEPWNFQNAPITMKTQGVRLQHWKLYNEMAGPIPWSPQRLAESSQIEDITLIPYWVCTTLRISAFPSLR